MESGLDFSQDFGFAFNNRNFSDRILLIEIVANPTKAPPESEPYQTLTLVAEKENGDEAAASGDDSNGSEDGSIVLGVKTLHISSPILATKSPFFYKLFTNGLMESEQRHATLRINASEEAALMELLSFMYSNKLHANTAPALLEVLMASDKFEVASCMRHCFSLLRSLALTPESSLLYLTLPPGIIVVEEFQPLMDAAKKFLAARYKDVSQHRDEIMNLPLVGNEAILLSADLQVPSTNMTTTAVMDFNLKTSPGESRDTDFGFAFNNSNFSDRVLHIEIVADPTEDPPESEICRTLTDCGAPRKTKRRRRDVEEKENALDKKKFPEEQILDCWPGVEDKLIDENHEEKIQLAEDSLSGDEAASRSSDNSNWSEDGSRVLRVKTLHISSPILAAKSTFFYKLFSMGMMESKQRHVTLRINASEEAAVMELLNFMHTSTLCVDTAPALLDVLMVANKFKVASCMGHCSRVLANLAFTPESALLYLNLAPTITRAEAVQPLMNAAKLFLAACFKDISKHKDEILNLPLAGFEAILSSDDLLVSSEDVVCNIALIWTNIHYRKPKERRDILSTCLGRYIRFPYMTLPKLRRVLMRNHFNQKFKTKAVLDALFFKADALHLQRAHALKDSASASHLFVERAYKYRPIKVVEFEVPRQQCVVYLDLKREECAGLFPAGRIYSQSFNLGGQRFFLSGHCYMNQQQRFGVLVGMREKGSAIIAVDLDLAFRLKPLEETYISMWKGNYVFKGGKYRYRNLTNIEWTSFMADDSPYFINEVMHIRAELTVKH